MLEPPEYYDGSTPERALRIPPLSDPPPWRTTDDPPYDNVLTIMMAAEEREQSPLGYRMWSADGHTYREYWVRDHGDDLHPRFGTVETLRIRSLDYICPPDWTPDQAESRPRYSHRPSVRAAVRRAVNRGRR